MSVTSFDILSKLPSKIKVKEILSSRYGSTHRPLSWDQRRDGIDVIKTEDDQILRLYSDGGQSPPNKNWILMVTDGKGEEGYKWTLYGLPRAMPS